MINKNCSRKIELNEIIKHNGKNILYSNSSKIGKKTYDFI